jgi:adhesin transport system outer membrane protein
LTVLAIALFPQACTSTRPPAQPLAYNADLRPGLPVNAMSPGAQAAAQAAAALVAGSAPEEKAQGGGLTLRSAVQRAVNWHPAVDEAVGQLNQSAAEIAVARAGYRPKISGGINSGYRSYDGEGWRPRLELSASQMLYDFGKVSSEVDAQVAGQAISRAELLSAVDGLIRDTAYAVVEVQRNQALRKVAADQVKGVRTIADLVAQRSAKGASTKSDEIQAEARVEAAQSTLLQIDAELGRWRNVLAAFTGSGPQMVSPAVPDWLTGACSAAAAVDWSRVPALMQAQARRDEAVAMLGRSRAEGLPTLSLEAGAAYDLNGSSSSRLGRDTDDLGFNIGFSVGSALYQGGAAGARTAAASHALGAADAARRNARFEVTRSLGEAKGQIASLRQLQGSLSTRSGMMGQTRDLYRQQYLELGTRSLLDLLNAEQEMHSTRFDAVNATHDIRRLNIDCMSNAGQARKSFNLGGTTVRGVRLDA